MISESLRLYPPVPLEINQNISTDTVSLPNGQIIKPGQSVGYSALVSGRNPDLWGHDVDVFRPERWMQKGLRPSTYEWPVFNGGMRACPGEKLARSEVVIAMREILSRYEFQLIDGEERHGVVGLTMPLVGGLPLWVRKNLAKVT